MKTLHTCLFTFGAALAVGAAPLLAHSGAVSQHVSNAATLSASASGQAIAASGELAVATTKVASGAAAVAFWTAGSAVASAGSTVAAVGHSTAVAGSTVAQGAEKMWDFASSDPARRPAVNRERSVPPLKQTVRCDPPPSSMFPPTRR